MHASDEQLLDLRDNHPESAEFRQHVGFCMLCRDRLDELTAAGDRLRRLPGKQPQADLWPEIQARIEAERKSAGGRVSRPRLVAIALAASIVLALTLYLAYPGNNTQPAPGETMAVLDPPPASTDDTAGQVTADNAVVASENLDALINKSAYLESVLDALPRRPRVMRASTTDLISGLQDGVALIDYQLNSGRDALTETQARTLWRQRIDLMNSLVYVRAAEAQQVAYIPN